MSDETDQFHQPADPAGNFVLLSGCSGGGKSTLLTALRAQGFPAFEEPGRQVVKEQMLIDGPGLPWRDQALFAELCVFCAIQQMQAAAESAGPVFFDRGIVDAVAFFDYLGRDVPVHLERAARLLRYNATVFLTPPWPEIYAGDDERRHSYDEAVAQYDASLKTFARLGYRPVELPRASVGERVDFVLACLETAAAV
ncbi:AAA family ATPase [Rhizobium sp. TRM96647]|uniref:AAA family ATPase n=1 Tax=unclassified Rhizobium TaxID=2613769 RepID=UPI0021E73CE8|nr:MULTISPECIES: AAA family ATPase [unclassified Rhizobium]MCV3736292.1 AAA family ATPase [Rhizobium sp. TRM96647]MCV3758661.1 AAA family ATPase [Rhizobium sp. TRM96650]